MHRRHHARKRAQATVQPSQFARRTGRAALRPAPHRRHLPAADDEGSVPPVAAPE